MTVFFSDYSLQICDRSLPCLWGPSRPRVFTIQSAERRPVHMVLVKHDQSRELPGPKGKNLSLCLFSLLRISSMLTNSTDTCINLRDDPGQVPPTARYTTFSRVSIPLFSPRSHCPAVYPSAYARLIKLLRQPLCHLRRRLPHHAADQSLRNLVCKGYCIV